MAIDSYRTQSGNTIFVYDISKSKLEINIINQSVKADNYDKINTSITLGINELIDFLAHSNFLEKKKFGIRRD